MTNSFVFGSFRGIPVGAHWTAVLAGLFIAANLAGALFPAFVPGHGSGAYLLAGVASALLLGASIIAHEFGHALTARRRGQRVDGITLWLLGGVARLVDEPSSPRHAAEVAAAGPAVSLVLAAAGGLSAALLAIVGAPALAVAVAIYLGVLNAGLALFNLLPVLPLDGGRLLQSWFWHRDGDTDRATVRAAEIGRRGGWAMALTGIALSLFGGTGVALMLVGGFVILQAKGEARRARQRIAARTAPQDPISALLRLLGHPSHGRRVATAEATIIDTPSRRVPPPPQG